MDSHQDFCSYELSKALKACGFDEPCDHYYNGHGNLNRYGDTDWINRNTNGHHTPSCSAPSLYHAQKWLREKKELIILIGMTRIDDWFYGIYDKRGKCLKDDGTQRDCYEAALSAGIFAALELIKKGE